MHRDNLHACRAALHPATARNALRGTNQIGRHNSLSGRDRRYKTQLVASHKPGQKENCSKNGYAGSPLSVRVGLVLYKQLFLPTMDYEFPAWMSVSRTHVRRLQLLQSKCLRLASGAPWYVGNRQIHEDLGVSLFAEHIRALTASFDSELPDVGNPLVRQLGRYVR